MKTKTLSYAALAGIFLVAGCSTPQEAGISTSPAQDVGMTVGAIAGAGVGAAVAGNPWAGAAIGAGGGLVAGLIVGSVADTWSGSETVMITKYVQETTPDGRVITVPYEMRTDRWGRSLGPWKPMKL